MTTRNHPYTTPSTYDRLVKNPEISEEHISYLYNLEGPNCRSRDRFRTFKGDQCKDNPNCFVGLRPPKRSKNSFGGSGLGSSSCGSGGGGGSRGGDKDVCDYIRNDDEFCGLKNLGATCYMNSLLQCLYFTPSFRDAVYNWTTEEETKDDHILQELKSLFAYLQLGATKFFVPTDFVNKLELKTGVQQDVQEFYQLLIFQYLEKCFKRSNNERLKTVIEDLFVAKGIYKTKCSKCLNSSDTKGEWNLLSLSIEDTYDISDALRKYLRDENLEGYNCEHCQKHTEVTRSTILVSLPPILNIQLLRFVYDKNLGTKKKLSNSVNFFEDLDMARYSEDSSAQYKLYAVICHIGTSASAGHYIAFIRDSSNRWWKFDDSNVTRCHGFYSVQQNSMNREQTPYILLYKRNNSIQDLPVKIPENIEQRVFQYNTRAMEDVHQQQQIKLTEKEKKDSLYRAYKDIKKTIHVNSPEYYWISLAWIKKWFNQDPDLGPIDNSELQCEHGAVLPEVTNMKRISKEAWDILYKKYEGGPVFTNENNCYVCATEKFNKIRQTKLENDEKYEMNQLCCAYAFNKKGYFYVSKSWLEDWRHKKQEETRSLPKNFTHGIACEHGNLVPDPSRYTVVPEKVFLYLKQNFPCDDIVELICEEAIVCPDCKDKKERESKEKFDQERIRDSERTTLYALYTLSRRRESSWFSYQSYYVISLNWFSQWCSYIENYWETKPGVIDNTSLICQHQLLNCDVLQDITGDDMKLPYLLVDENIYKKIVERYGEPNPVIKLSNLKCSYHDGITDAKLSPEVCIDCTSTLKQIKEEEAKNFKDQLLQVKQMDFFKKTVEVKASCNTTVAELKLLIFEKFEVEPRHQKLICDKVHLNNSTLPLSHYGVTPMKMIHLHNEYSGGCEPMEEVFEKPDKEIGFAGTNLTERPLEKRPEKQEEKQEEPQPDIQEEKHPEKKPKTSPKEDPPLSQWPQCKNCTYINTTHYNIRNRTCEICDSVN